MKHIIYTLILLFSINSIAQQIVPLETEYTTNFLERDTYFKDINGELDKFIGTWKYEDTTSNTVFEITLSKIENTESAHSCTEDRLTGQFKLVVNGIEQYNTYTNDYGKMIMGKGFNPTYTYLSDGNAIRNPPSVNRYHMAIVEPSFVGFLHSSDLTITYENNSGVEKINWNNEVDKAIRVVDNQQVNIYQMPLEMELIKQ